MSYTLILESAPHIRDNDSVSKIMWAVVLALVPAGLMGIYYFGLSALVVMCVCMLSCVLTELVLQLLRKKEITVMDGSALLTGLLLAYNLPSHIPLWMCVLGSVFSIVVAKQLFGGLGYNIFNPALAGRVFLLISYPVAMTSWPKPTPGQMLLNVDVLTGPTPLGIYKEGLVDSIPSYLNLFLGNRGGCLGEVCGAALLLGAVYLVWRKCISLHIPLTFIGMIGLGGWLIGGKQGFCTGDPLFHVLTGGVLLGACFMATDMVTSPLTAKGKLIFGVGCGFLTIIIRRYGGYPEGVSFAILLMNTIVPLIDRVTQPRVYGTGKYINNSQGVCERIKP